MHLTDISIVVPVFPNRPVNHDLYSAYSSNVSVPRDAVVLDVDWGTGALSLFVGRAGMQKVDVVDANKIADKAEGVVKTHGYTDVATCVRPLTSPRLSEMPTTCSSVRATAECIQLPPNTRRSMWLYPIEWVTPFCMTRCSIRPFTLEISSLSQTVRSRRYSRRGYCERCAIQSPSTNRGSVFEGIFTGCMFLRGSTMKASWELFRTTLHVGY